MEAPLPSRQLLNPRGVARVLGLSVGHIYRLVQRREIPFVRVGGSIRFRVESLDGWIARNEVGTVRQAIRKQP